MARFGSLGSQYFDNAGDPLVNGKIRFYESGTTTDKTTYADAALTIPNTNPVILSAAGRQPNIFFNGTAKAILFTSDDVQIEVRDPVGEAGASGAFDAWDSAAIYNVNDIVEGTDGRFYVSITNGNQNNNPTTSAANWTAFDLLKTWNTNETYAANAPVIGSDGVVYTSIAGANQGNDPTSTTGFWRDVTPATFDSKTLNNTSFTGSISEEEYALTGSDLDASNGTLQTKTATANVTFTDGLTAGESLTLRLIDGDLHTIVFPAAVWKGGAPPTTFSGDDLFEFTKFGTDLLATYVGAYS